MTKFKVGDKVIITQYYKMYPDTIYPKNDPNIPQRVKHAISNRIEHHITRVTNKPIYILDINNDEYYEEELAFAKISNWKSRLE